MGDASLHGTSREEKELRRKRYHELLKSRNRLDEEFNVAENECPTIIDHDVARTNQDHSFFAGGKDYSSPTSAAAFNKAQQVLRRILSTACWEDTDGPPKKNSKKQFPISRISMCNPPSTKKSAFGTTSSDFSWHSLPYVQGMNEMAAVLLYAFSGGNLANLTDKVETDVFWCFRILMCSANPGTYPEKTEQFRIFLKYIDPSLFTHVQSIDTSIFSCVGTRWMAILFSQNFSLDDCLQIWDFILSFGYLLSRAAVYVGCGICVTAKNELMNCNDTREVMTALNSVFNSASVKPILETTRSLMLKYPFDVFEKHVLGTLHSPFLKND